jgi:PAS domain S-box-containing protein
MKQTELFFNSMNYLDCDHILKLFFETYPGIVAYIDKNFRYQFLSPSYETWFGKSLSGIQGKTIEEFIGTDKFQLRKAYLDRVLTGEKVKFNAFFQHPIHGPMEVEQIYQPDFDDRGEVRGFLAMAYDITEQRKNERLADEKEARFHSLRDLVSQIVWEADIEGNIVWFNKSLIDIVGASYEEILGQGWLKYLHPDDLRPTMMNWERALLTNSSFSTEYRVKIKTGEYRWFKVSANPVLDDSLKAISWVGIATDIDEQRSAKDLAERERKKIYTLLMEAPLGIMVTNGPQHFIELQNESAKRTLSGRDFTGQTMNDLLEIINIEDILNIMHRIYETGEGESYHAIPIKFKDSGQLGETLHIDISLEPIFGEDGKTTGIFCMGRDVSMRVIEKNQEKENEIIFKSYAESMPQIAFITDACGHMLYFNQQWYNFSGDKSDTKSWDAVPFIHPDDLAETRKRWKNSIKTGCPFEIEYRLRKYDGSYRWHLGRALPLKDSKGRITKWVGTDTDIHGQKELEGKQNLLLQLMDSSSDFMGMTDRHGKIIHINAAGKEIVGINENDEVSKHQLFDFIFPEDIVFVEKMIVPTTIKAGKWVGEFRFKNLKSQKEVWMHNNTFTIQDELTGEITGFAAVSRDITELKQKEKKLEEALKARDQFLSMASHELKTPLTSLKLQAQLNLRNLLSRKEVPIDRQVAVANQTNDLVGRLTRLIDDMLDVSRIRTGKLRLEKGHHEMGDIVREVVLRMSVLFEAVGLSIPALEVQEKVFGFWDRFRIEQVIGNLLTNAIRYGRGKPIELRIRREEEHVLVSIKDQGYGIAKEDLLRIFDRFERAAYTSELAGLGLGLFISREIIEAHDGHIFVESELDEGSTFHICIPLAVTSSQL